MKRRILSFLLILCMLVSMITVVPMTANATDPIVWDGSVATSYASGSGIEADPFIINNGAQLAYFASRINSGNDLTAHFEMGANITMNIGDARVWEDIAPINTNFLAIGWETKPFAGTFDGQGYTISGLYIADGGNGPGAVLGLFGCTNNAIIKNFAVINSIVKTNRWSGGIIGEAKGTTTIQNVYCDMYILAEEIATKNGTVIGGIVGGITSGAVLTVENCVFSGIVISETTTVQYNQAFVGGILGMGGSNRTVIIRNCLNAGKVKHTMGKQYIGGFVGKHDGNITIENCINAVAPISTSTTGITDLWAGNIANGITATITNCLYVGSEAYNKTGDGIINATNIIKVAQNDLFCTSSIVDTTVFTEWTKRIGDYTIPKGVASFAPTVANTPTYEYTPVELQRVNPESVGLSSAYVSELVDGLAQNNLAMHSIMLLKNGKVFAEGYAYNYDEDSINRMYSVSKSFVSIAIGLLIEEGKISLDDTVAKHFPEYITSSTDIRIKNTTIEDMLKMSTPFSHGNYTGSDSTWIENFFTESVDKEPGSSFYYDTLGSYLLGAIVERQTGMDFLEYLKVRALNKMGFSQNSWCVEAPEGYAWGGSGVMCTTSDLAKFALLVMNGGVYNGEQLLPADYVQAATSYQIDNYEGSTTSYYGQGYGYQIWLTPYGFTFLGMGNQLAICVPEKDLVFVCTADTQGNTPAREIIFNLFEDKIMDNIQESPLAENQTAYNTMQTKLQNMLLPIVQGQTTVAMASTVNNRTYNASSTSALISKVTFEFFGDYGVLNYTTPRGDKELTFGLGRNVVCTLDEPQYSGTRIGVSNGVGYRSACSGAWTDADTFVLSVQVIDDYLGNMKLTFDFTTNSVKVKGTKTAEYFLNEYVTSGINLY